MRVLTFTFDLDLWPLTLGAKIDGGTQICVFPRRRLIIAIIFLFLGPPAQSHIITKMH